MPNERNKRWPREYSATECTIALENWFPFHKISSGPHISSTWWTNQWTKTPLRSIVLTFPKHNFTGFTQSFICRMSPNFIDFYLAQIKIKTNFKHYHQIQVNSLLYPEPIHHSKYDTISATLRQKKKCMKAWKKWVKMLQLSQRSALLYYGHIIIIIPSYLTRNSSAARKLNYSWKWSYSRGVHKCDVRINIYNLISAAYNWRPRKSVLMNLQMTKEMQNLISGKWNVLITDT